VVVAPTQVSVKFCPNLSGKKLGRSELAATSTPVLDEAIQAILGMNQKHILFACPGIFQPP